MKSIHHGTAGANVKLRGKITYRLCCGCCDLFNWKWSERMKQAKQEIRAMSVDAYLKRNK